jgi:hypothetical protein
MISKPELETLDYRSKHTKQPASPPPATMGFNSHVFKPETGVKKDEVVGQLLEQPIKSGVAMFANESGGVLANPEQPNLTIILEIECLISQVSEKIGSLNVSGDNEMLINSKRLDLCQMARKEIDLFQKTTLHGLRKEFE